MPALSTSGREKEWEKEELKKKDLEEDEQDEDGEDENGDDEEEEEDARMMNQMTGMPLTTWVRNILMAEN